MRAIDHLVLPVTTLMLARSRLTSLGFNVAPDARHPFGTGNCCVFFENRTFLEPVTILDRSAADQAAAEGLFFVKRIKRFTERHGEGFAMVALKGGEADSDRADFERAGIGAGPPFHFARKATLPDGSETDVGFVLTPTSWNAAPDAAFFACRHLAPDVLFQRQYLEHPNGARGVASVAAVAENPADFRTLLSAVIGQQDLGTMFDGLEATVDGGALHVLTPAGFRARFGVEPPAARGGLRFAAFELGVADLERAIGYAGPAAIRHDDKIVVPPAPGLGAVLAFTQDAHA